MSTTYRGNGTLPTLATTQVPITSSTNATPISVNSPGHGLNDGDTVVVEGHSVNTAANGRWPVTRVDANNFILNGSVGIGVGGATGYFIKYSLSPGKTIPSDGDPRNAASINAAFQALTDADTLLAERVGKYRLYDIYSAGASDDTWASWSTNAPGQFGNANWNTVSNGAAIFAFSTTVGPVLHDGDVLEMFATVTAVNGGGVGLAAIGCGISLAGGAYSVIVGSGQRLPGAAVTFLGYCLHGFYRYSGADTRFDMGLLGYGNGGSPQNVNFVGHRRFTVNHYRNNG